MKKLIALLLIGAGLHAQGISVPWWTQGTFTAPLVRSGTTISMPPASATDSGYVTTGAQTIAGAKTFSGAAVFGSTMLINDNLTLGSALGTGAKAIYLNAIYNGTTAVMDASRNLSNIGTIGSGAITSSGDIISTGASTDRLFIVNSTAGYTRAYLFRTNNLNRWGLIADSDAESGGNAGSNFVLRSYTDAGGSLHNVMSITRSTGNATFAGTIGSGAITSSGTVQGNGLKIRSTGSLVDSIKVVSDTLRFYVGGVEYKAVP